MVGSLILLQLCLEIMLQSKLKGILSGIYAQPKDFALLLSNKLGHNFPCELDFLLGVSQDDILFREIPSQSPFWHFGLIDYDLKNAFEDRLFSANPALVDLSSSSLFFRTTLVYSELDHAYQQFGNMDFSNESIPDSLSVEPVISRNKFLDIIQELKRHIQQGDIYEINYCIPYCGSYISVDWSDLFFLLNAKASAPFSVFARLGDLLIVSASPERFFKKNGNIMYVQPMKGTYPRFHDTNFDNQGKFNLQFDEKERAENCMIVDLTRNDLSRICKVGSVKVDSLCEVFSFPNVHQMVSTISGELCEKMDLESIIKAIFPMGSMTGAPKIKAMELIEQFECFKRGPFSGSFGYVSPDQNMDFNVLIRSIFVDLKSKKFFFATGSAITINSDPEKEWEEVVLKGKLIQEALKGRT
jgi:para-aminobenzoate synthetase component 1